MQALFNNRKLHTGFLLVQKSVTLNSLEQCCVVSLKAVCEFDMRMIQSLQ